MIKTYFPFIVISQAGGTKETETSDETAENNGLYTELKFYWSLNLRYINSLAIINLVCVL